MTLRRVVVVGGSIAALTVVSTLRAEGDDGAVTVLSDEDRPAYSRVPLSKAVLCGTETVDDASLAPLGEAADLRLRTPARGVDLRARVVETDGGPVPFDGLVIASSARARRIGTPDQIERTLRTHHDCRQLATDLVSASSVVIVGGSFLVLQRHSVWLSCLRGDGCGCSGVGFVVGEDRWAVHEVGAAGQGSGLCGWVGGGVGA
ncbi:FAD/NAD(P)-binding oxidoreductase [Nocardia sp. NPDC051911]|uniref:FAD/NAD(P)-binding oxidoreductase n=1 Tax=Nocardia sp. NPDC051911 TaxID=3154648 RepID=UPI00342E3A83